MLNVLVNLCLEPSGKACYEVLELQVTLKIATPGLQDNEILSKYRTTTHLSHAYPFARLFLFANLELLRHSRHSLRSTFVRLVHVVSGCFGQRCLLQIPFEVLEFLFSIRFKFFFLQIQRDSNSNRVICVPFSCG